MSYITDTSTPASKVIHLDSKYAHLFHHNDEDGNQLTSSYIYHMNEAIVCPDHLSMICSLHTATIPYSFYNIRHNVNNALIIDYTDFHHTYTGTYKLIIPSGNYTAGSFLTAFIATMTGSTNFLTHPWTSFNGENQYQLYVFNHNANRWLHQTTNPFLTSFYQTQVRATYDSDRQRFHLHKASDSNNLNTLSLRWDSTETTANDLFGFRADAPQVVPYSNDGTLYLASDKVIDMNDEIHGLYLRTSLTTDGTLNAETGIFSNILARISINASPGGIIFHTPNNSSHKLQISLPTIKYIGVKLTDDQNRLIDLNGMNFQISVQIDFVPRLQSLRGMTRAQRRDGEKQYQEYLKRSKIEKRKATQKQITHSNKQ